MIEFHSTFQSDSDNVAEFLSGTGQLETPFPQRAGPSGDGVLGGSLIIVISGRKARDLPTLTRYKIEQTQRGAMMKKLFLGNVALVTLINLGSSALAADIPVRERVYQEPVYQQRVYRAPQAFAYNWTGFYVGGHVGGGWADAEWTHTNTTGIVERFNQDASGLVYGGHAGAMYQFGNFVVGIEGTYTGHDFSATNAALNSVDRSNSFDWKTTATVVGRFGYAWDRWLGYFQGGWATAEIDFRRFITSTGATTASSSDWDDGWTIGIGGAYAFHRNIIFGVEYNYVRIGLDNRTNTLAPGFAGVDTVTNATADRHQVTARLSFKFP